MNWQDPIPIESLLETSFILPASFYERDARGVPRRWVAFVKQAMLTVTPRFSSRRMLKQYVERAYAPAIGAARK